MRRSKADLQQEKLGILITRMRDIYSESKCYGSTHESNLERMKECIWNSKEYKALTMRQRSYLSGYDHALFHAVYNDIYWILLGPDGKMFAPKDDSWLNIYSDVEKTKMSGMHVWANHWDAGKLRIWS